MHGKAVINCSGAVISEIVYKKLRPLGVGILRTRVGVINSLFKLFLNFSYLKLLPSDVALESFPDCWIRLLAALLLKLSQIAWQILP